MPEFDLSAEIFGLPWWAIASLAGLIVLAVAVAIARAGWAPTLSIATQLGVLLIAGILGLSLLERMAANDAAAERRAFEQRLADLDRSAQIAGSSAACLDGLSGEVVGDACEKAIFSTPETVAAATSYVAGRLALLRDGTRLARDSDIDLEPALSELRRFAENDRFGFVAQVLAVRHKCTADSCDMLALLQSPQRVIANFKERTFDIHVGRHVAAWLSPSAAAPTLASASPAEGKPGSTSTNSVNIDFPTASSIPPVSIMNNEPGMPGQNGMGPSPAVSAAAGVPNTAETARSEASAEPVRPKAAPTPTPRPANRRPAAAANAAPQPITPQQ